MTPRERLRIKLNKALEPHGLLIAPGADFETPTGGERRYDTCRWYIELDGLGDKVGTWGCTSWDTITQCVRGDLRLLVQINAPNSEAGVMISAVPLNKARLYFAHPVTDYDTQWERDALSIIAQLYDLDLWEIVNPNTPEHDAGYKARGMDYFFDLLETCHGIIWSPFPDGSVGAGVAKEVYTFTGRIKTGKRPMIYELDRDFTPWEDRWPTEDRLLTVDATRAMIKTLRVGDSGAN